MKLIIAEKPSVAQTIAAILGAKEKKDGFLTGSSYIVSWCVGHLVGLAKTDLAEARLIMATAAPHKDLHAVAAV